jgi:hypothetical protein
MLKPSQFNPPIENGYKNVTIFFVIVLAVIVLGFFKTYFGLFPSFDKVTTVQHIHGLLFTTWFVMLCVQPLLIRYDQYKWHRIIGKFSYVLVPCIIISIHFIAREAYLNMMANHVPKRDAVAGLYMASYQIFDFTALYLLAIANTKNTPAHMRYMITTSLAISGAGFRRLFEHWMGMGGNDAVLYGFLVPDLALVGLIIYDRLHGQKSKAYWVSLVILVVSHVSFYFMPHSAIWQSVCGYFVKYF